MERIVRKKNPRYFNQFEIDDILTDILSVGRTSPAALAPGLQHPCPDDSLVQLFPGADRAPMPPDLLVHVEDKWTPTERADICPASIVICKAMGAHDYDVPLPFTMGVIVAPLDPGTEGDIIVQ